MIATIDKPYTSANLREQGVVLATTHIQTSLDWCAALPHDDGPAGYHFAGKLLAT